LHGPPAAPSEDPAPRSGEHQIADERTRSMWRGISLDDPGLFGGQRQRLGAA
jgi:hypothetical protein